MQGTNTDGKLLEAAHHLILARGYRATTVDEICSEAGVSKGSFYHFFKTKEELGLATLARFYPRGTKELMGGAFTALSDPLERAFGFVDHTAERSVFLWTEGCLLGSFATELADSNPTVRAEVSRMFRELVVGMSQLLEPIAQRAKENGPTAVDLAEMFLDLLEGSIVVARAHREPQRIPAAVGRCREYLERLIA